MTSTYYVLSLRHSQFRTAAVHEIRFMASELGSLFGFFTSCVKIVLTPQNP